jgi:hypothetical protein
VPSPSEVLAVKIVERLLGEGLLAGDQKARIIASLADGSMSQKTGD